MSPLHKRRKIDVPNQVDDDTVAENEANGELDTDSELEFEDDSDLGEVEDIELDGEILSKQEQTVVLGLQS